MQLPVKDVGQLEPLETAWDPARPLRVNPDLRIWEQSGCITVPRLHGALRLSAALRETLAAFRAPSSCAASLPEPWLLRLLNARVLVPYQLDCLITGCGRSGTQAVSSLMVELGADVPHETAGLDGIASWLLAVDAAEAPWGPVRRDFQFETIIHQIRHPLAVIGSAQTFQPESWRYIDAQILSTGPPPSLLWRCANYWHRWNLEAERGAAWRYQIEDLPAEFERLCERVGVEADRSRLAELSPHANTRAGSYRTVTWRDLEAVDGELTDRIRAQARRYGYEC